MDKKWTINSYEADIVRDIFTRYKNGEKAKEIIARLNGQGIKTKAGSSFNMNSLARIIRNEKYIGKVTSHGTVYTNVIPPIVDEELFYECNAINHPTVIKRKDTEELISHLNDIASNGKTATNDCPNTTRNNSPIVQKENSLEPQGFKRVSLGGEDGIRTHVRLLAN